jgi:hypothetical protein
VTFTLTDQEGVLFRYNSEVPGVGLYTVDMSFTTSLTLPGTDIDSVSHVETVPVTTDLAARGETCCFHAAAEGI